MRARPPSSNRIGWIILIIAILVVNSSICFRAVHTLDTNATRVAAVRDTLIDIERLMSSMKDAETGQRGFIITGKEDYLVVHDQGVRDVRALQIELAGRAAGDGAAVVMLRQLDKLIEQKFEELARSIRIRREHGFVAALAIVTEGSGKTFMDEIRKLFGAWSGPLRIELLKRDEERRRSGYTAITTLIVAGIVNIATVLLVAEGVRRDAKLRARAEEETRHREHIQSTNAKLQSVNDALEEASRRLTASNRELQDFASVASHDLQEPLRKIQAFGDRLRVKSADRLGADGEDYLQRMQHAAGRMQVLINDLLTYSRVTTRAREFEEVDLGHILKEVLVDLETRVSQNSATIHAGELPRMEADASQMRQLFQNLLSNALKFHREGVAPILRIDSTRLPPSEDDRRERLLITVADNGIGFEEKYLDRIFTIFQRLHGRGVYEGTGVGLAVCRKIVERHQGTLTARSTPGEGSTFEIRLPLKQTGSEISPVAQLPDGAIKVGT